MRGIKIEMDGSDKQTRLEAVPSPLSRECPFCGAGAGGPCLNSGIGKPTHPHDARVTAAEAS